MARWIPLEIREGVAKFPELRLPHGFSTMSLGDMRRIGGNEGGSRERFFEATGLNPINRLHAVISLSNPEVATRVLVDDGRPFVSDAERYPGCGGIATNQEDRTLSALVGDAPAVFVTDGTSFLELLVCARQNVRAIIRQGAKTWERLGIDPKLLKAYVGPGVCAECYETDPRLAWLLFFRGWGRCVRGLFSAHPRLDLMRLIVRELEKTGIGAVDIADQCTATARNEQDNPLFFSHVRGKQEGNGGDSRRFIVAIALASRRGKIS